MSMVRRRLRSWLGAPRPASRTVTKQQADPVLSATEKPGTYLAPSVTRLNQWVNNEHMFPGPADLKAEWNSLQPWFEAVWPVT